MSAAACCLAPRAGAIRAPLFPRSLWVALAVAVLLGGPLVLGEAAGATGASSPSHSTVTGAVSALAPLPAPTVAISSPIGGATYSLKDRIPAAYSCTDGAGAPGIASCHGTVQNGQPINTTILGRHTFTVAATSSDGQSTTATATYTVAQPSNHLHVIRVIPRLDGTIAFKLHVPGPGKINILETASYNDAASIASLYPGPGRFAYARKLAWAARKAILWIKVLPNKHGHWLLHHHAHRVTLRIRIAYTPLRGHGRIVTIYNITLIQRPGPMGRLAVSGQIRLRTSFTAAG